MRANFEELVKLKTDRELEVISKDHVFYSQEERLIALNELEARNCLSNELTKTKRSLELYKKMEKEDEERMVSQTEAGIYISTNQAFGDDIFTKHKGGRLLKILDQYFLVLSRMNFGRLDYRATGIMSATFTLNLLSLAILLVPAFIRQGLIFWLVCWIVPYIVFEVILNKRYNKYRSIKLRVEYENESEEVRGWRIFKVVLYELASIGLLVFAIAMAM